MDTWMALVRFDYNVGFCAGFVSDWVHFLHSSPYGDMFWIYEQNSTDNTGKFSDQCSHRVKVFSTSHIASSMSRLGVRKKLWGDTDGDSQNQMTKGIFYIIWHYGQQENLGEGGREDVAVYGVYLPM